jgi:ParB/RepB/Spo0J family partition protein
MIHIPDDKNGRAELNMAHARELADQINKDGLLHPITLRPRGDGFELIAGRHRLEAFKLLGWNHAPSIVKHVTDYQAGMLRMSENVTRSQLSPAEEAFQLAALLNETPGGVDELAARTGRSVHWILDRLDMCDWPADLMQAIHHNKISLAAGKHLAKIPDPETMALRVRDAVLNGISARTASLWLQQAVGEVQADFVPPENWCQTASRETETTTFANCVCCFRKLELDRMRLVRVCTDCLGDLETANRERTRETSTPDSPLPQSYGVRP